MSKPETNPNDQIVQKQSASLADVLSIWIFHIGACFGFQYSDFEFVPVLQLDAIMLVRPVAPPFPISDC